jgi:hypothetical protein
VKYLGDNDARGPLSRIADENRQRKPDAAAGRRSRACQSQTPVEVRAAFEPRGAF